jgi:hypothetical protein
MFNKLPVQVTHVRCSIVYEELPVFLSALEQVADSFALLNKTWCSSTFLCYSLE